MARLGLGYEQLRAVNPKLIYCSISGYGQSGPRDGEAGHDINYIGNTGLLDLQPGPVAHPVVPPMLAADIAGGSFPAVINILLALRARDQSGQGCFIDIAMTDAMFTFGWAALAIGAATGNFPKPGEMWLVGGSPRYQLYATKDKQLVACGALEPKFWAAFTAAIGLAAEFCRRQARARRRRTIAVAKLIAAQDSRRMEADLGQGRLLRHRVGAARTRAAGSAFRRARTVRLRGGDRVGQNASGGAVADRAAISRQARRRRRRPKLERSPHQPGAAAAVTPSRMTARRKRPDAFEQVKPEPARALHGEKIGKQRAVEQVDGQRASGDIAAAHLVVGGKHIVAADVARRRGARRPQVRRWRRHRAGRD